jgi:hypothetical protein
MKLSKSKVIAIAVGAVVVVFAMIGPAIGGSSLKKLVKKEVNKQLKKKTGPAGPAGATKVTVVRKNLNVAAAGTNSDFVDCPAGQKATGGGTGFVGGGFGPDDYVVDSQPANSAHQPSTPIASGETPTAWYATLHTDGSAHDAFEYVICAAP